MGIRFLWGKVVMVGGATVSILRAVNSGLQIAIEHHLLIRRLLLLWVILCISLVVWRVTDPAIMPLISTPVASVMLGIVGLLGTIAALYPWSRKRNASKD